MEQNPDLVWTQNPDLVWTKIADLKLRQRILLSSSEYGWATVVKLNEPEGQHGYYSVTVARPFMHTAGFSYTGGVLHYTGIETFKLFTARVMALPLGDDEAAR